MDRDTEIAIELLCDHLSVAIERIEPARGEGQLGNVVNLRR